MGLGARLLLFVICSSMWPVAGQHAGAQTPEQSLREREAEIGAAAPDEAAPPVEVGRVTTAAPPGAEEVSLRIASVELVGRDGAPLADPAGRLPISALHAAYEPELGRQATLADLYGIARELELLLKREGFVFTRVVLPRQELDPAGAQVRLLVLDATVERVVIEEPEAPIGPVREQIERIVAPLRGLPNPRIEDLERASLLATDLPGVTRATFVPGAGSAPGLLTLSLNVERDPFDAVGLVTHRDSPLIGPGVIGGIGYANTYGPLGASSELAFFNSWGFDDGGPDLDERSTIQLTQKFFLGGTTRLSLSGLYSWTNPGADLAPLDIEGEQLDVEFQVEHPLIRTRQRSLWVNGGFDWTDSEVHVGGGTARLSDDSTRVLFLGGRGAAVDPYGTTRGWLSLRQGLDILGASDAGEAELSRAGGSGEFFLLRGEVSRDQPIWREFSAHARLAGQWSPDVLLASEAFGLGGYRYLKGYDPSERLGDSGIALHGELRYSDNFTLEELDFGYELYGFGGYGVVYQSEGPEDAADLASAGAGIRLDVPNGPRLEVELAKPLDDDLLRTGDRDIRVLAGLVWFF